jgi:hypothetical protein
MQLTDYQRDILIRTALGEARGQGVEGMADVIQTIFNRSSDKRFPSDPAKAALQNKQYSAWNEGEGGNNPWQFKKSDPIYKQAEQALDAVLGGRPDYTGGALFYHTPGVDPYWADSVNKHGTIERNGHVYYPNRPVPPGELPQVASALDVNPPSPGVPVTASPDLNALRNAPSQQPDMRAALDLLRNAPMGTPDMAAIDALYAAPSASPAPVTDNDLLLGSGIADTIAGTQALQKGQGDLAAALEQMLRPSLPKSAPRIASATEVAAAGAGSPWSAEDGPAMRPRQAAARTAPPMPQNVAQSYAGQERVPVPVAQVPTRAPITNADLILDSGISDTVAGTQAMQREDLASALEQMLRPQVATRSASPAEVAAAGPGPGLPWSAADGPKLSSRSASTAPTRSASPIEVAIAGSGMPWSEADGPKVSQRRVDLASAPRVQTAVTPNRNAQDLAAINAGTNWTAADGPAQRVAVPAPKVTQVASIPTTPAFAPSGKLPVIGPTGGPAFNTAPRPAEQSIDLAIRRAPTQSVSLVPTVQAGGVGQPPATKTVQSVPVTAPKTAQTVPQGMPTSSRSRDAVANQKAGTRTAAMFGSGVAKEVVASPAKPNPTGYGSGQVKTDSVRLAGGILPASADPLGRSGAPPVASDLTSAPQIQVAAAPATKPVPVPRPHSERPYGVGTQLAVTPPVMRNVPVPRPRPSENPFGSFVNTAIQNIPMVRMANQFNTMMLGNGYQRGAPGSGVMYQQVNLANAPKSQQAAEFLQRVHSGGDSGYTSLGNGSFADQSGGVYYDRHIK